jgi:hypothetical protein
LRFVHLQTLADDFFLVIRPLDQSMRVAALLGMRGRPGRRDIHIENPSAVLTNSAAGQAFEQDAQIHVQEYDRLERRTQILEQLFQCFGLGDVAGKAIQYEALGGVRSAYALADHAEHSGIIDQLS